jgi:DNA-binding XRE family transcriptional regulator
MSDHALVLRSIRDRWRSDPSYLEAVKELKPYLDVADDIYRLRLSRQWSQGDLAKAAGVSRNIVTYIEAGTNNPTLATLKKIADAFGAELTVRMEVAVEDKEPT